MGLFDKLKRDKGYRTLGVDVGLPKKTPEGKKTFVDKVPHIIDLTPVGRATSKVGKVLSAGAKSIIDKGSKWAKEKSIAQQQHGADYGLSFGGGSDPYGLGIMGGSGGSGNNDPYGLGITGMNVGQSRPKSSTTSKQRIERAILEKKAQGIVRSLGVSKADAIEYLKSNPQKQKNHPKKHQKNYQKPYTHHQESDEQRRARERKIYNDIIKKGTSPSYALMQIERERNKR